MANKANEKPKNSVITATKRAWPILMALLTLLAAIGAGIGYDSTLTKNCEFDACIVNVEKTLNIRIDASNKNTESLKALLLLKISEDLLNTLTQRSWDIKDRYPSGEYPKNIKDELRRLDIEITKVSNDRKYWRQVVLDNPYSPK